MKFNISAFTDIGTLRKKNQDSILVNNQFTNEGFINLSNEAFISCFVADGVGGNRAGEFASKFILEKLINMDLDSILTEDNYFSQINDELIALSQQNINLTGTATTLSGIVYFNSKLKIVHSGDSEVWLLRNDSFIKLTNDQVLNTQIQNSPITSYFGGNESYLTLDKDIFLDDINVNDKIVICSDGLFKTLNQKQVKSIINADKALAEKTKKILQSALQNNAEDNLSVILIDCYN
jgi:protein phosphatase